MQALCVRLAVSDAIVAYLFGYIRSFFRGRYCRGIRGTSLLYMFWSITFFYSGNPGKLNCFQTCIYIIYILFCLIGFMNFSPQLYLIRKDKKTLSIGFYYTIHFILIVFFSDTRIHTFIIFALILLICFCCQYFFSLFQILKSEMGWQGILYNLSYYLVGKGRKKAISSYNEYWCFYFNFI